MPEPVASWLADGLRWYADHEGVSLDEALLLKPAPGKPSIWRQARYAERDHALHTLAVSLHGVSWQSAEVIAGWLATLKEGDCLPPEPDQAQAIMLYRLNLLDAPSSTSQVWRILKSLA